MKEIVDVDPKWLIRWNRAVPRYTSYPTAPQFHPLEESIYRQKLLSFDASDRPLSVYIHIPFCRSMCLYCGCSVILNRKSENQRAYVELLLKEIEQLPFQKRRKVTQLHLGGGTPTLLTEEEFALVWEALHAKFDLSGEISIEIDPRTVFSDQGKKLKMLRQLGVNRVSFGVQDLDPAVQEAVKRRQSEEMTRITFQMARAIGFEGINIDLIYGLPLQTAERFALTAAAILAMRPDRIAFFSYAKVPWLKMHQKAIREETLPSTEEKFAIYVEARKLWMEGGYLPIGMDHFALSSDSMAKAYREKRLTRNFQGYSVEMAEEMIGLGVSSIGCIENGFFQNVKTIEEYRTCIERGSLPLERGCLLKGEDHLRRWVIQSLMCHFEVDKILFERRFGKRFDTHFAVKKREIEGLQREGLLEESAQKIAATPLGRLFIRLIASLFDAYLDQGHYSKVV